MPRSFLVKSKKASSSYNVHRFMDADFNDNEPNTVSEPPQTEPKESDPPKRMPLGAVREPVEAGRYSYVKRENKPECPIPLRPEQLVTAGHPYYISEPQMAEFPPYYKPPYAWETLHSSYAFRQLDLHSTILQHTSNIYGSELKQSPEDLQPLDCSTHYSPTSETYHCITCDKVNIRKILVQVHQIQ
ncbi:Zinc finger protein Gfi-1b [Bagarius yarrelli]|uniref:Zinc finger protein Gfi-1b n=1 Tax=Bagarius yarrelli TaxID=175774 RepID=A0A556TUP4_BAGYA|nr:Zinc finger protein Gfi-1b [Bagarius yarrelli]